MLSEQEKREMLEDAQRQSRKQSFRFTKDKGKDTISFDDYLLFLDSIQKIFAPFAISCHKTITKINKL